MQERHSHLSAYTGRGGRPTNSRSITGRYRKPVTSGNNIRFIVVHYRPFSIYFVFLGERRPTFMVGTDFRRCTYVADIIIYTSVNTYWGLLNTYWYKLCLKCSKYDGLWLTKCFTVTAGNIYALPCVTESENKTTTSYNIFVYYKTLPFVTQYYRSHFHVGRRWPLFS